MKYISLPIYFPLAALFVVWPMLEQSLEMVFKDVRDVGLFGSV